jgi:hypothetical protein
MTIREKCSNCSEWIEKTCKGCHIFENTCDCEQCCIDEDEKASQLLHAKASSFLPYDP